MRASNTLLIERSRPNRHIIELRKQPDEDGGAYWVTVIIEGDYGQVDEDDYEFATEEQARAFYTKEREALSRLPNWAMQRQYDEAHGTVNASDPRVDAWRWEQ